MSNIAGAQHWLKSVISGQPLHRDELGEENKSNGTLSGVSPATLQLVPQLQRELSQELAAAPKPELKITAPSMGPGGNSSGNVLGLGNRSPKPPSNKGKKED